VASWLVRSSLDPAVRVQALAGEIVLYSWAGHITVTVPLSGVSMGTRELNAGGDPAMNQHPIQGGAEILLVASCYRNREGFSKRRAAFWEVSFITRVVFGCHSSHSFSVMFVQHRSPGLNTHTT